MRNSRSNLLLRSQSDKVQVEFCLFHQLKIAVGCIGWSTTVKYVEIKGKLSAFGWMARIVFWAWQLLVLLTFITATMSMPTVVDAAKSEAEQAGAAIGATIGFGISFFFWACGSIPLGLWVYFTRPVRALVPQDELNRA